MLSSWWNQEHLEEIQRLKEVIARQEQRLNRSQGNIPAKGLTDNPCSLHSQMHNLYQQMRSKRSEYKQLMRQHFKMVQLNSMQQRGEAYLEQMFSKKILNVIYEIDELVCSKSSKSSLSTDTMEGAEDWLFREKEAQTTKEIYKLNEQIKQIEDMIREISQ